jgi:transcriptional regulator with XRE-family HTH domain
MIRHRHQPPASREARILGRALALLRISRGVSQRKAAKLAGTSGSLLSKWEHGAAPSFTSVQNLLRGLGLSWAALERAQHWSRERTPRTGGPPPAALPTPPVPDLAELAERLGKTVALWYLQVVQRELTRGVDRPDEPTRRKRPRRHILVPRLTAAGKLDRRTIAARASRQPQPPASPSLSGEPGSG